MIRAETSVCVKLFVKFSDTITKVITFHYGGGMIVCTKFYGNASDLFMYCCGILLKEIIQNYKGNLSNTYNRDTKVADQATDRPTGDTISCLQHQALGRPIHLCYKNVTLLPVLILNVNIL